MARAGRDGRQSPRQCPHPRRVEATTEVEETAS